MGEATPLRGLRRDLTREDFEELCALQCAAPEILGWAGVTEEALGAWVRDVYGLELGEAMEMIRQDGLIEIRKASFDQLKKSATLIQQQFNRFLSARGGGESEEARRLAREIFSLEEEDVEESALRKLFGEE